MADEGRRAACERVVRQFPELAGVRPVVESRGDNRVFTFSKEIATSAGGPRVRQIVRVTVDPAHKVVKIAVSR